MRQTQTNQDMDTCKNIPFLPTELTVPAQREDDGPRTHSGHNRTWDR